MKARNALRWLVLPVGALALLAGLRLVPAEPLASRFAGSTAIYAEGEKLLRLTLARDEQYRLWVPLDEISSRLQDAVQHYEDRWFHWHPGVNPLATLRGAWATYARDDRKGGSTLTMQLARRVYGIDSRSVGGKLHQIAAALWLEARYSKRDILEAYLNVAPYGGNIEGVGAASRIYFGKSARDLTLPEALALAVIPQNPRRRAPAPGPNGARTLGAAASEARLRLWDEWRRTHPEDARYAADMVLPLAMGTPASLALRAPHLTDQLLLRNGGRDGAGREIHTGIDLALQGMLERILRQYVAQQRSGGINNAAALLLDHRSMQIKALVGSADWFDASIAGQVNGALAKRSPGSTLKPFIYALGLDQGLLHPLTVLKDAPTSFGPFSPENFDGRFVGPITARDALVRSRNIPAVAVSAKLSRPGLYDFLKQAGVAEMASESHYGLALVLGGGEVTMEELARLYAILPNRGLLKPVLWEQEDGDARSDAPRLLSEEAAYLTLDMLAHNPRPDTFVPARPTVAWKTGTSWAFRDAWSAGVFGRYVLVVWVGNFDGSGSPAFVGVKAAAPLFFRMVDGVRAHTRDHEDPLAVPPRGLRHVDICAASGDLPNSWCSELASTWFIPGKSPIRVSTLHRPVFIDTLSGQPVCSQSETTRTEIHEFWPSDLQRLFRDAGMPRREPPTLPDCGGPGGSESSRGSDVDAPQIVSPLRAVTYTVRLSHPESIALRANRAGGAGKLFWFVDKSFIAAARPGEAVAWSPQLPGHYVLRVVDETGRADSRDVEIEYVP